MVKNVKTCNHEYDPFDIVFHRDTSFHEVSPRIDAIGNNYKIQEFLDWQFKRKKAFLKESTEKQSIEEINIDEEEDEQFKSKTKHDHNVSTLDWIHSRIDKINKSNPQKK